MGWDDLIELLHQIADVDFETQDIECLDAHGLTTSALTHVLLAFMEVDAVSVECAEMIQEVTSGELRPT